MSTGRTVSPKAFPIACRKIKPLTTYPINGNPAGSLGSPTGGLLILSLCIPGYAFLVPSFTATYLILTFTDGPEVLAVVGVVEAPYAGSAPEIMDPCTATTARS